MGLGLPPGFDYRQSPSFGLCLVQTLVQQLRGTVEVERGGTEFKVVFTAP